MKAVARYWEEDDFVWPPKSYFCNFCGREFGSAQALGGHMNVHRRDRARLNQSSSDFQNPHHHHHHYQNPGKIVRSEYPYTLVYNPKARVFVSPPLSSSSSAGIFSTPFAGDNWHKPNNSESSERKENVTSKNWRNRHELSIKKGNLQVEVKELTQVANQGLDLELRLGCSLL